MSVEGSSRAEDAPPSLTADNLKGLIKESVRELLQDEPTLLNLGGRTTASQDQPNGDQTRGEWFSSE